MAKTDIYLASKPRYEILDGLRGVAALMVVIFHCFETYIPVFGTQIVNHGYLAGTLIGAALFFFAGAAFPETLKTPFWKFALCLVMGLLILPCPNSLDIRGWGELNSFNGPQWTLTFEYIGNILYAFVLRRLPKIALAILCVVCAFFTLDLTMGWVAEHPDAPLWIHIAVNLGVVFLSIVLAWGVLKIYDEPVREWLKEHWLKRKPAK